MLFLQANDTFFFRDGRPFTKGEQSEGYAIFPPLPSTILGALRTAYIAEHGDLPSFYAGCAGSKITKSIGTPNSLGSMHLKGVFLADKGLDIYFPIPLDLVVKKNETDNKLYALEVCLHNSNIRSNTSLTHLLRWNEKEDVEAETSGKLANMDLTEYLLGEHKNGEHKNFLLFRPREDFVVDEPKIGIERSRQTLTSEDGMLYRINMSRFQSSILNPNAQDALSDLGFLVDYQCDEILPAKGLLKLGGEGRSFLYQQSCHNPDPLYEEEDLKELKTSIEDSGMFKLYFAMPTIFENGWLPNWIDKATYQGLNLPSGTNLPSIKLITAAVGKTIAVGGWDMKNNMPKPTQRAVPAGSVYYFKMLDDCHVDDIINTFHYKNISDCRAEEGYGLCFVGAAEEIKI